MLRITQVQIVCSVGGQADSKPRIGMVREQPRTLVLMVVVEGQLAAGGVGQLEHRIQGGIEPPGIHFRDDLAA